MTERLRPASSAHPELSAMLDGELSLSAEQDLRERLAADVALRLELRSLTEIRDAVRALGPVDVPVGALDRPSNVVHLRLPRRSRRGRRSVGAVAAAVAAVWVFVLISVAPAPAQAVPAVAGSIEAHRASVESLGASPSLTPVVESSFPEQIGAGLMLQFVSRHGSSVHAMYANADEQVSIFQQPGRLAWDKLPAGGEMLLVDDLKAWTWDDQDLRVVVFERDDTVFTFVSGYAGERPSETTASNTSALPESQSAGLLDRLSSASHRAALLLGLG